MKLTATITNLLGLRAAGPPIWCTSDPRIATVDSGGTPSPVAPGTCDVYALVGSVRSNACAVTVAAA